MLSGPAPHQLHTPSLRSLMTTMQSAIWTNMDIASSERSVTYEEPGGHDEGIPKQALPPPIPHRHHQQHHRHPHHPLAPGPLWQRREVPPRMVAGPKKVVLSSEDTEYISLHSPLALVIVMPPNKLTCVFRPFFLQSNYCSKTKTSIGYGTQCHVAAEATSRTH